MGDDFFAKCACGMTAHCRWARKAESGWVFRYSGAQNQYVWECAYCSGNITKPRRAVCACGTDTVVYVGKNQPEEKFQDKLDRDGWVSVDGVWICPACSGHEGQAHRFFINRMHHDLKNNPPPNMPVDEDDHGDDWKNPPQG